MWSTSFLLGAALVARDWVLIASATIAGLQLILAAVVYRKTAANLKFSAEQGLEARMPPYDLSADGEGQMVRVRIRNEGLVSLRCRWRGEEDWIRIAPSTQLVPEAEMPPVGPLRIEIGDQFGTVEHTYALDPALRTPNGQLKIGAPKRKYTV